MPPSTSYLVCATARSGSTLLCETLVTTGMLGNPDVEYFYPPAEAWWSKRWKTRKYQDYVKRVMQVGTTPNGVFGVKLMFGYFPEFVGKLGASRRVRPVGQHLAFPEPAKSGFSLRNPLAKPPSLIALPARDLLESVFPQLRYIFVTREDKIRQAVSHAMALQTGRWTSRDRSQSGSEPRFDFDQIDQLLKTTAADEEGWWAYFREADVQPLTVTYEQLVANPGDIVRGVFHYLCVAEPDDLPGLAPQLHKQAGSVAEEWVGKYLERRTAAGVESGS